MLTALLPKLTARLAKSLMPDRAVLTVLRATSAIELVALLTVFETECTALETKWPMLPRPQRCGLWPALIRLLNVETALKTWLWPREAR